MGNIQAFDLQSVYEASSIAPHVTLSAAQGGLVVQDNAAPLGAQLFGVRDNAAATLFGVDVSEATFAVNAVPSGARDIGTLGNRWRRAHSKLDVVLNSDLATGAAAVVFPVNAGHGGLLGGTQSGAGATTHRLNGNNFAATICLGLAAAQAAATATLEATRGAACAIGSSYAYGSGVARVAATGYASVAMGYAYGSGTSTLLASQSGSLAFGYAHGRPAGSTATIQSSGRGAFASGLSRVNNNTATSMIQAGGDGSFAQGATNSQSGFGNTIQASGRGSFAQGFVGSGVAGANSFIISSGEGSFAQGRALNTTIAATADNAVQFGPGTNSQANSLQIGTNLRFHGIDGAFTAPADGDFYAVAGVMSFRSNGALHTFNTPAVAGSRGANAALASLLTQLATMGLIVDNTVV